METLENGPTFDRPEPPGALALLSISEISTVLAIVEKSWQGQLSET